MKLIKSKYHFIGIGGIGMCGLAEVLYKLGAQVTGSDLSSGGRVSAMKALGIKVSLGHEASNVGDADVVVYSSAIRSSNPEIQYAQKHKIPLIPRAEALAELMRLKRGVAIAGTHGKTTTTSLCSTILIDAGVDPTVLVGGRLSVLDSTACWGKGDFLVAEADESDGSFWRLSPELAVITNIEDDHLDHFGSFENLQQAFYNFAERIPFYGALIYCLDDPKTQKLFENFPKPKISYGFSSGADYQLKNINNSYFLFHGAKDLGEIPQALPGAYNALNATAALIVAQNIGVDLEVVFKSLKNFQGVDRRYQRHPVKNNILVIDDYAHHPTEVKNVILATKKEYPEQRLVCVFQPHRYSRLRDCWDQMKRSFDLSDLTVLADVYPAGESPLEGFNSKALKDVMGHLSQVHHVAGDLTKVKSKVQSLLQPQDVVLVLGAGDIYKISPELA